MKFWGSLNLREYLTIGIPKFICQISILYSDNSTQLITSDESWKVGNGAILRNNLYLGLNFQIILNENSGEVYDARLDPGNWSSPNFDDSSWEFSIESQVPSGQLKSQNQAVEPVEVMQFIKPVSLTPGGPSSYLFDFGFNHAGRETSLKFPQEKGAVELSIQGPTEKGTVIKIKYGELLYPNGTINVMTSVAGQVHTTSSTLTCPQIKSPGVGGPCAPPLAFQSDVFILNGSETGEKMRTHFTYHGYRYFM